MKLFVISLEQTGCSEGAIVSLVKAIIPKS